MGDFTIESMDISGLDQAPCVTFSFSADSYSFEASPPGGHIRVSVVERGGGASRIVLTNTLTSEVFADLTSRYVEAPSTAPEWENAVLYAAELACAMYWSMWRMQQLRKRSA